MTDLSHKQEQMALMAAQHVKTWGGVLPVSKNYNLPSLLTREDMCNMTLTELKQLLSSANWHHLTNQEVCINLDHPDVSAVI